MTIFSNNYLPNRSIERAMQRFAKRFDANHKVLDIGCGRKPYARYFLCEYIGLDQIASSHTDVVANAWDIPFTDDYFNGVILNQSLEHIEMISETIAEVKRVLKPGGYGIITVPQTMKNHSAIQPATQASVTNFDTDKTPYWRTDYWRFTKYGLMVLFKDFKIIYISETTGYVGTLMQLINYFFASLGIPGIFAPIYAINNVIGLTLDGACRILIAVNLSSCKKFHHYVYSTLTINYILVIQKHAEAP